MKEKLNFTEERINHYKERVKIRWDDTYTKEGYKASHNAGNLEKTIEVAETEMDLFLFPTKEKCEKLYNDKNIIPIPTFGPEFYVHEPITHFLKDLSECVAMEYGSGYMARYADAMANYFKEVHALDISKVALENSKKHVKNKLIFTEVNGVDLHQFEDESIDFVFSNLVFQHIGNKEVIYYLIKDLTRILKKGGVSRIEYSNHLDKKDDHHQNVYTGNGFTQEEIIQMYEECGQSVKSISEDRRFMWVTGQKT